MNFNDAIAAHTKWKTRLRVYITGGPEAEEFDLKVVSADNLCALGKWIYGEGKQFSGDPAYGPLKEAHAKLHKCTAGVIEQVNGGKRDMSLIEGGSEYAALSSACVKNIMAMRGRAA